MSEDTTQEQPGACSFEERVFARFDALDSRLGALENKVEERLYDTKPIWERALAEIAAMRIEMNERFNEVDKRFTDVDKRFAEVDERFSEVDKRFDEMNQRFARVDERFDEMNGRFARVDERFFEMNGRFGDFDVRFDRIESIANATRSDMLTLRADFKEFKAHSEEPT